MKDGTAEKRVTKVVKILLVTRLGRCDDRLTAEVCTYRVIDSGKRGARLPSSCAHVQMERHPEFHVDCAYMGRATEDRESWMCGFSKGQWLIARDRVHENVQQCVNVDKLVSATITSNVQALTVVESDQEVTFDQETSITDVKFTRQSQSCGELRSAGGSSNVSKESPMSASTENALIEKSVREMQSTSSMVQGTTSDSGGARPHVIKSQPSAADVKTACKRRKRKSCRKALVKLHELVMLMTIDKPEHQPYAKTIMLDLVGRSDEVVVGTTDRVVKARIVHRVSKEQRDGARDTRSVRGVPWQQTSTETAGGELRARVSDLWSSTLRWVVQLAGSQPRDRRKIFTHTRAEGCDVAGRNSERSLCGDCSIDRKGHGTERRQSSLVPYQARSRAREVWILQRL